MMLLVRHGETEWNVQQRFQGRRDSPLTERGRRQAKAMAGPVRDLVRREAGAWRLISSPLPRAHATAEVIAAATGLPLETDDRLMEVNCGAWEGRTWAEVGAGRDGSPRRWLFDSPGGESFDDVRARVAAFLDELDPEPRRRVVVVSHGAAGRILRGVYGGLTQDEAVELEVPHGAVFRLQNGQIDRFDCAPVD
jgi:broad specificity phosphatase PhoE